MADVDVEVILTRLLDAARAHGVMIATAESCTGGMLAALLTERPGSSDVFDRGCVTYTNAAKISLLGVAGETLHRHGAVSEEVAREMATGVLRDATAGLSVSITGIAGPGGSEHKPEGRVCFATCLHGETVSMTQEFGAIGRDQVRRAARDHALRLLYARLKG